MDRPARPHVPLVHCLHSTTASYGQLRADGTAEGDLYEAAKQALTWYYQRVVVHDFLTQTTLAAAGDRFELADLLVFADQEADRARH